MANLPEGFGGYAGFLGVAEHGVCLYAQRPCQCGLRYMVGFNVALQSIAYVECSAEFGACVFHKVWFLVLCVCAINKYLSIIMILNIA